MKTKFLYITLLFVLLSHLAQSQSWGQRKYEFYYGIGAVNFMGDIGAVPSKNIWVVIPETISPTLNAGLIYNFSGRHHIGGTMFLGQMYAKDHDKGGYGPGRKDEFNSFFTEISARYDFTVGKGRTKKNVYRKLGESRLKNFHIPLYLFTGLGGTLNIGQLTSPDAKGEFLVKTKYTNLAPVVFFGFGFKWKLSNSNYISTEANYRLAISDGLDGAKGKDNPAYGEWYDSYQTITVNYTYKLRSKRNGMPQFKKR